MKLKKLIIPALAIIGAWYVWTWASPTVHKVGNTLNNAVEEVSR